MLVNSGKNLNSSHGGSLSSTLQEAGLNLVQQGLQSCIWHSGKFVLETGFRLQCQGREYLPEHQPYIIAANHASHLDGPAIIAAYGKPLTTIYSLAARDYFFDRPTKQWISGKLLNLIPCNRGSFFRDCLPICKEILTQNKTILIFPEGTRSATGELQAFKAGFGFLALKLGVPIVPAYIAGSYQALPKGQRFPRRCSINVTFGKLLGIESYPVGEGRASNRQLYQEIADDVRSAIVNLQEQRFCSLENLN
jgi:long-chain acyl-CoA synthetase